MVLSELREHVETCGILQSVKHEYILHMHVVTVWESTSLKPFLPEHDVYVLSSEEEDEFPDCSLQVKFSIVLIKINFV